MLRFNRCNNNLNDNINEGMSAQPRTRGKACIICISRRRKEKDREKEIKNQP